MFSLKRPFTLACTTLILALCFIALGITLNLSTFQKLTREENVAELAIEQTAPQQYLVRLFISDKAPRHFTLNGDAWQLDARILKWHPWVNIAGLHTWYRLERLSSRYNNPAHAQDKQPTIVSLTSDSGKNLSFIPLWLPLIDTTYGNSTYMPLTHGARYRLLITTSGIIARPANGKAKKALQNWH